MKSVHDVFQQTLALWPERPFLHLLPETAERTGEPAVILSYAQAGAEIAALAGLYRNAGYGPGHRVGLMLDNRPGFFLHWLALNACRASVIPLNAENRPAELDYVVAHSGITLAITAAIHLGTMSEAASRAPQRVAVCVAGDIPGSPESASGDGDECAVLYTSGTTGKPKGCVLANSYFIRAGQWYRDAGGLCTILPGQDRLITPLPMTHMNAMAYSTMAMLTTGGCIIPLDRFHPRTWWASVRESQATVMHYLGVMPSMLLSLPVTPQDGEHDLRFGFGAGVDRRHHELFEQRFKVPLLEAWAMTETGAGAVIIANRTPRHVGAGTFGAPEPSVQVRIVDEQGAATPGGPGELLVRAAGPDPRAGFFTRYLHDATATEDAWQGGWFHTGDIVRQEPDGAMIFVDRRKNVIRRSGENIASLEVETVLRRHPAIREVAVTATPDEIRGEEVLACIVPHTHVPPEAQAELAEAIVRFAATELSYFKLPGFIAFRTELPLTATQKIQRGEVKSLARTLPGQPGCIDTTALKSRLRGPA